ncbi:MAG TPA: PQQ-binding-like beta-propeller repeat protein [Candidatus Baltobacteraceae bacterium]|jgi:outer membrane protein assembly factor BamB|nr:PQQ-binding-like beta-propeller repeat protein [Candidatus Baltobacteraceae bacterium]
MTSQMWRLWTISALVAAVAGGTVIAATQTNGAGEPPPTAGTSAAPHSWPGYQYRVSHNAVFEGATLKANWLVKTGAKINGGLAVVDGTVYAVSFDQSLYAIEEATGRLRWSARADNILMSTPIVTPDGLVIVGSGKDGFLKPNDYISQTWGRPEGDDLYAFRASDGSLAWKFHTDGEDMPSPALSAGTLVFANGDGHAYALDGATGKLRWKVELAGIATMASMTIQGDSAFFSTCHNAPYVCETRAVDITSGRTLWTNPYGGSDCTPAVENGLVFVNSTTAEDKPYYPGGRDTVVAIDQRTGETKWKHEFEPGPFTFIGSAERQIAGTVSDGTLYQPIGNLQRVVAFDERTGRIRWTMKTTGNVKMSPVVKGETVYFGDTLGVFYSVDRRHGTLRHALSFLAPFSVSPPVIDGQTILMADGALVLAMPLEGL